MWRLDYLVTDQIKVFGRVDNLFNVHYQNPTGFLQPQPRGLWRHPRGQLRGAVDPRKGVRTL